jgi:hypothetical protein
MRIVVSGTHASGKSTLISDFVVRHPEFAVLPDPFESIDEEWDAPEPGMFAAQLRVAADRLLDHDIDQLIAERGPLDFVAYLRALGTEVPERLLDRAIGAMQHVDLLAVLPLSAADPIRAGADEYAELRADMNDALLDLIDDPDLVGQATVVELTGDPAARLAALESAAGVRFDEWPSHSSTSASQSVT